MLQTATFQNTATLDRLLGGEVRILKREPLYINRFVRAEYLDIMSGTVSMAEEDSRLFVYPVEDGVYNLQLLFINRESSANTMEVCWLQFLPEFFTMFAEEALMSHTPFRFDQTAELQFNSCTQSKALIGQMKGLGGLTPLLQSLQLTEYTVQLLRRAIEAVTVPFSVCPVPACRFLAHESEREKIFNARTILESTIDAPLTIKELSRKVAMNECYLKKGFKTLTGKTINEYQQDLRITKAKELLSTTGQSVTDVAAQLGYSSISHFSTAFKKATGLKPCELLG